MLHYQQWVCIAQTYRKVKLCRTFPLVFYFFILEITSAITFYPNPFTQHYITLMALLMPPVAVTMALLRRLIRLKTKSTGELDIKKIATGTRSVCVPAD